MNREDSIVGRLLDVAEKEIAQNGLGRLSLSKVAERAGSKNRSAVAYHFGSKAGLLESLIRRPLQAWTIDSIIINRLINELDPGFSSSLELKLLTLVYPSCELIRMPASVSYYYRMLNRIDVFDPKIAPYFSNPELLSTLRIKELSGYMQATSEALRSFGSANVGASYLLLITRTMLFGFETEAEHKRRHLTGTVFDEWHLSSVLDSVAFLLGGLSHGTMQPHRPLLEKLIVAAQCNFEQQVDNAGREAGDGDPAARTG